MQKNLSERINSAKSLNEALRENCATKLNIVYLQKQLKILVKGETFFI